jgi:tungstate transport system substrate-binding protein
MLRSVRDRTRQTAALLLGAVALATGGCGGDDAAPVILATTTSTQDSGLLDELIPRFEEESGREVKTIAVGSGEAIELGARGEADVVLAHSPAAEEELMAAGKGDSRRTVMHNDFVVVGPGADPAGVRGDEAAGAFAAIADGGTPFISRGDESGTHAVELGLWKDAGVAPAGAWYQETGQGMGATLQIASEKDAYTLADRGTYLATDAARELEVLVDGGTDLVNVYHVIAIAGDAGRRVNVVGGRELADFLVASATQARIGEFGVEEFGEPLFVPDAGKTDDEIRAEA